MVKRIFTFLIALLPIAAVAQTHTYIDADGIKWYYKLSGNNATLVRPDQSTLGVQNQYCRWTDIDYSAKIGTVRGVIKVPATVSDGTNTYPVTKLESLIFWDNGAKGFTFEPTTTLSVIQERIFQAYVESYLQFVDMTAVQSSVSFESNWTPTRPITRGAGTFYRISASTLIYLPNGTNRNLLDEEGKTATISMSGENIVDINFIIDGVCNFFKVYDKNLTTTGFKANTHSVYVPHAFTAKKAYFDREFSNTTGFGISTLYLPFPTKLPSGMRAYELKENGFDAVGDKAFIFTPIAAIDTLKANHPYLVQITDGQNHRLDTMYNVKVPATPDISTTAVAGIGGGVWQFNGTTETIDNATAAAKGMYNLKNNRWYPVRTSTTGGHIAAFRCFVNSTDGSMLAKGFAIVLDDNETTSIDEIRHSEAEIQSGKYRIYDLSGRFVGTDLNTLPSGQIYIANGKKFYKM